MQIASFDRWITQFHIFCLRFASACEIFEPQYLNLEGVPKKVEWATQYIM